MRRWVKGLHHVTGAVASGQRDVDFYTGTLGLRLVKKTVNHETGKQWHFFYGDHEGHAGTIMTNFFMDGIPLPPAKSGRGSITRVSYSVPEGSLDFWRQRLEAAGLSCEEAAQRFGEEVLQFEDANGLPSELIACSDPRTPTGVPAEIGVDNAVRGFHSTTLCSRLPELTRRFFTELLDFEVVSEESDRTRLAVVDGAPGQLVDLVDRPDADWGSWGMGGIHHVAFEVADREVLERAWQVLSGRGLILTDLRDRKWFHSMYLTEPGGINIEFSDTSPGWTVDEPLDELGSALQLPKQFAGRERELEASLPPIDVSATATP